MSILDGITEKTTKADLMGRLRDAAKKLATFEDEKAGRLQRIEERVRAKYTGNERDIKQALVSATEQEWIELIDFLENFEDLLPLALVRLHDGAKILVGHKATPATPAP